MPNVLRAELQIFRQLGSVDEARDVLRLIEGAGSCASSRDRNFKESDRIRDELAKMGVVLKDSKDGTTWEIAR